MCIIYDIYGKETELAWVVFRIDAQFKGNISIDAYMLLDASEDKILSVQCVETYATRDEANSLIHDAYLKVKQQLPKVVLIAQNDPAHDFVKKACEEHNFKLQIVPDLVIAPLVLKAREIFNTEQLALSSN